MSRLDLTERFYNKPIALDGMRGPPILALLAPATYETASPQLGDDGQDRSELRSYDVLDGIAIVPVQGILVHRFGLARPAFGMTGYDGIGSALSGAMDDRHVRGIVLDVDSVGGEIPGLFDLADAIHAARGRKPIWAIMTEIGFSAAYAIASAADRIIVPRTGGVGGVGVIALVVDISKMLTTQGVKVNVIQFGARKADGLSVLPLAPAARARFQADVDRMGELFVKTVARNRGISAAAVRATQGATYLGANGVRCGLADAVASPDAAFAALRRQLDRTVPRRSTQKR